VVALSEDSEAWRFEGEAMNAYRWRASALVLVCTLLLAACNPPKIRKAREPDPGPPPEVNIPADEQDAPARSQQK
jgi:hypothetical protein